MPDLNPYSPPHGHTERSLGTTQNKGLAPFVVALAFLVTHSLLLIAFGSSQGPLAGPGADTGTVYVLDILDVRRRTH